MKALHCYSSDVISDGEEEVNDYLNETFSKNSGTLITEERTRFSDISQKSNNRVNIKTMENNYFEDET